MENFFNQTDNEEFRRWMPINEWRSAVSSVLYKEFVLEENYNQRKSCNQYMPPYLGKHESNHYVVTKRFDSFLEPTRQLSTPEISLQVKPKITYPGSSTSWSGASSEGGSISPSKKYELPMSMCKFSVAETFTKPSFSSKAQTKICNFCRQNGDRKDFFTSHYLRDSSGNVECPVLRKHVCEVCGATGDTAHTISYCPILKAAGRQPKNAVSLKFTRHNSSGKRRK